MEKQNVTCFKKNQNGNLMTTATIKYFIQVIKIDSDKIMLKDEVIKLKFKIGNSLYFVFDKDTDGIKKN